MLKIYGADLSAPSNKVRMAANAMGLDYDYIRVSIKDGETRTEEYLKMHPAGKVPVIDDGGFVLFESGAIIKYLAVKNASDLYPAGVQERAVVDQWMDFSSIHIGGAVGKVAFNRIFAPRVGVPVDERSLKDGLKFLNRFLPVVDRQLEQRPYLAGPRFSLADIDLAALLDPAEAADVRLEKYPRLLTWRQGLRQEDFYTRCHASYEEALKKFAVKK